MLASFGYQTRVRFWDPNECDFNFIWDVAEVLLDEKGGAAPRACIYLWIPNGFQYVEARLTPCRRSTSISGAIFLEEQSTIYASRNDRWAQRKKNTSVIEISITEIERRRSVFCVCLHNVSGAGSGIASRKRSRTSICILSLLDSGRKVRRCPSIMAWRVVAPISRLIRIDFPLSVFLGNRCAPPFRLTSCLSSTRDNEAACPDLITEPPCL